VTRDSGGSGGAPAPARGGAARGPPAGPARTRTPAARAPPPPRRRRGHDFADSSVAWPLGRLERLVAVGWHLKEMPPLNLEWFALDCIMLSGRVIEIMVQRSNQVNFITDTLRVFIRRLANTTQPYFYIYLVHGLQVMDRWRTLAQYGITELSERPCVNIVVVAT
jgi:hypothetical protein